MTEFNDIDNELLAQMREDFLAESQEILDRLGGQLARLEQEPTADLVNSIFREVHTLKSTAGFIDLKAMQKLAHKLEDVFGEVRASRLVVTPKLVDVAFGALQLLTTMRDDFINNGTGEADISWLIERLDKLRHEEPPPPVVVKPEPDPLPQPKPIQPTPPPLSQFVDQIAIDEAKTSTALAETSVRVETEELKAAPVETTLRVETETLDVLMTLVGELITARNALLANIEGLKDEALLDTAGVINRLTSQLQTGVSSMRLVPVERLLNRFTPVIRNLAREREKQVRYTIEGGDTPLDRAVSEQMHDALVHMLRNAIDHGLETPAERRKVGKSKEGMLRISAERRGDDIILRMTDDGRGIDPYRIRQVAVERGLYSAAEAEALSDAEAVRLIFAPGFSTASAVTNLSGRGVGMDVVLQNVRRLRGSIDIETALGRGTTFIIQMPLTLAILQVLLVRVGQYIYAIPLHLIRQIMQLDVEAIQFIQRGMVIFFQYIPLPVRRLSDWLEPTLSSRALAGKQPAIVVHLPRGDEVVVVDELIGKQQMVIKPLSPYLGTVKGVDGAAILPNGSVTLILDIESLLT